MKAALIATVSALLLCTVACASAPADTTDSEQDHLSATENGPRKIKILVDKPTANAIKAGKASQLGGPLSGKQQLSEMLNAQACQAAIAAKTKMIELGAAQGTSEMCKAIYSSRCPDELSPCFAGKNAKTSPWSFSATAGVGGGKQVQVGVEDINSSSWSASVTVTFTPQPKQPDWDCKPANQDPGYAAALAGVVPYLSNLPECATPGAPAADTGK